MGVVNGKVYDWSSISIKFPGLELEVQEINYNDELEKELAYGKGQSPRGYGEGNYKADGKMSLLKDDFDDLLEYSKKTGIPLYKIVFPKVIVSYANADEKTRTDVLNSVTITKVGQKGAQGDKSLKVDLDILIVKGIERDGVKAI